jgi:hypothetical protein
LVGVSGVGDASDAGRAKTKIGAVLGTSEAVVLLAVDPPEYLICIELLLGLEAAANPIPKNPIT